MFDPRILLIVALVMIVISSAFIIGAAVNEQTKKTTATVVGNGSADYNSTIAAAGTIQVTTAQFMNIPVLAILGALSLGALFSIVAFMGMGGGRF